MNQVIQERIAALRKVMEREGVDYYMVPTADFHNSEYVDQYFKMREYLSGFTGSNGTLVVSAGEAGLWTDGRYFIQAEQQLAGSGIDLYRSGESGHIFTEFEIISYILTMMKIRRRNNININPFLSHRTAKGIDPLLNIHVNYLPICI